MATKTFKSKDHIYAVQGAKKDIYSGHGGKKDKLNVKLAEYNLMYGEDGNDESNGKLRILN